MFPKKKSVEHTVTGILFAPNAN